MAFFIDRQNDDGRPPILNTKSFDTERVLFVFFFFFVKSWI
jgi:hypothetical protein